MPSGARVYDFNVLVDHRGTTSSGLGGRPMPRQEAWWAEHLVLAALLRCTLASLEHAARRADVRVTAGGEARGTVTRREDGLYAFVEIESRLDVSLVPAPGRETIGEVIARAERGCFVGNSLTAKPRYRWRVNGVEIG